MKLIRPINFISPEIEKENFFQQYVARLFLEKTRVDLILLITTLLLLGFGLAVIYGAAPNGAGYVKHQIVNDFVGLVGMFLVVRLRTSYFRNYALPIYLVVCVLVLFALFFGVKVNGSRRWINLYFVMFQPSELLKIVVPMLVAQMVCNCSLPIQWRTLVRTLVMILIPSVIVYLQPDLGTALLVMASGLSVIFIAGLSWRVIIGAFIIIPASAPLLWFFVLKTFQKQRILTLINPDADPLGAGWQILQSRAALGSGGLFGKGWLNSTQARLDFLPESHTDFILAVVGEQFGFFGVFLLFLVYGFLVLRALSISLSSPKRYNRILGASYSFIFLVYVIVNAGMVSGFLPTVGVPLLLISYGGSSILSILLMIGIIMAIGNDRGYGH